MNEVPCRCGSGAHPRRCERHPEHLRVHGALLSIEGYLEGNEDALGAVDELISALRHEYAWSDARIHALAQAGASAFNAWRTHADIIGPMHVLREVVGAEFVDGQRNRPKEGGGDGRP